MSEIGIGVTLSAHYARRMANHDLILSENISAERMHRLISRRRVWVLLPLQINRRSHLCVFASGAQSKQGQSQNATYAAAASSHESCCRDLALYRPINQSLPSH